MCYPHGMSRTSLTLRLKDGDMFIHLNNASFSPALREVLREELPDVVCTPITEARMEFLRVQSSVSSIFSIPHNKSCTVQVETAQKKDRSSAESTSALRAIITAIRRTIPSSSKGSF